jgi:hypothetical protein
MKLLVLQIMLFNAWLKIRPRESYVSRGQFQFRAIS